MIPAPLLALFAIAAVGVALAALDLARITRRDHANRRTYAPSDAVRQATGANTAHLIRLETDLEALARRVALLERAAESHQRAPLPPQRPAGASGGESGGAGLHDAHRARTGLPEWVDTVRMGPWPRSGLLQ